MRRSVEFAAAVGAAAVGAAAVLLIGTRVWQVVRIPQPRPLPDDVLALTGRTVDAAGTALAVVALAGVVAVLATRGIARRVVGVIVTVAGVGICWRAATAAGAVGAERARALLHAARPGVSIDPHATPAHVTSALWPWLAGACGILVALAGGLVAARGQRWSSLSARYENQAVSADAETAQARAAGVLWNSLDRGDDPTTSAGPADPPR